MFVFLRVCFAAVAIVSVAGLSRAAEKGANDVVLFQDDFHGLRSGPLSEVVDAQLEYQYLREVAPKGAWAVSTYVSSSASQLAWRVIEDNGAKAMAQMSLNDKIRHVHPMLVAGDSLWANYTFTASFVPQSAERQSGVAFCYRNDRCYYFFGVDAGQAVLKMVRDEVAFRKPREKVLATAVFAHSPGKELRARIRVANGTIRATLNEELTLTAKDSTFTGGKIALVADVPTVYRHVRVTTSAEEKRRIDDSVARREAAELELQRANPKLKLWKRLKTEEFGTGRNLRFGDLDNDGKIDILFGQVVHHGPKDRFSELSCLTAMSLDGRVLWQVGEPDSWKFRLTNDVAFQIQDLDGDGRTDVVYTRNQELIVADGATGKTKYKVANPAALPIPDLPDYPKAPKPKFSRVLGDALMICDLRGRGRASDIVMKDRYHHIYTFDYQLKPLWQTTCNTGHYPYPADVDGDAKDEIMIGYSLFDDDGTRLWTVQNTIRDHADAVALVKLGAGPRDEVKAICAASDDGVFIANLRGEILKHHRIGHAQNLTIANLRDDLPGLEMVSMNFWGNQGIIHFYDSNGDIYHDFEPCQHGSPCLPVNWTGRSEEFFLLTANPEDGGMFDGHGRRVVRFPMDGHPDMCNAVLDLTGDARDEIVVWDPYELWIYTQDDGPKTGRIYKPQRNPPWRESNYRAAVSQPGWTQEK